MNTAPPGGPAADLPLVVVADPIDPEARQRLIDEQAGTECGGSRSGDAEHALPPARTGKKYNLGCGNHYLFDWINIDRFPDAKPDIVMNLERFPWPIENDSADEVLLNHVLEHLGGSSDTFLGVMQELYRICQPGTKIVIRVPDPRHDDFFGDPTHQRPIAPPNY